MECGWEENKMAVRKKHGDWETKMALKKINLPLKKGQREKKMDSKENWKKAI